MYFFLQTACLLLKHIWAWCNENEPENIRLAIADLLGTNFMLLAKTFVEVVVDETSSVLTFWNMASNLLQDECELVRMQMCTSLHSVIPMFGECFELHEIIPVSNMQ